MDTLAAEREVIAVDMPGFGDSPELPAGVEPTATNLATAVLDFYDSLAIDERPAVAGISLGGWAAIECARQGGARSVVALCPAGFWKDPPGDGPSAAIDRARRIGRRIAPLFGPMTVSAQGRRRLLGRSFVHPERLSPREAAAIAGAYVRSPAYARASSLMRSAKVEDLKQVKVPITIAWGEHDALVRNKPLRDGILPKRVRQLVLPGCGHVPTWDDPDLVARVVLDGTAGG